MADDGNLKPAELAPQRRLDLANEHDFQLGAFRVRPAYREVRRGDVIDILEPRVMQVLAALARRMGAVVSRDELLRECWGDVSVTDDSLHRCIGRLRKLAESDGGASFAIETVPRVGYRLVPAQGGAPPPAAEAPAAERRIGHAPLLIVFLALLVVGGLALWWRLAGRPEAWRIASYESLIDSRRSEGLPALSASGRQIAYALGTEAEGRDILIRNIRDGSTAPLSEGPEDDTAPAWSPGGDRVAFVRLREGAPCEILVKTLPAGPVRSLARCEGGEAARLVWSPDGSRLFFSERFDRRTPRVIKVVAADGGPVRRLTAPPADSRGDMDLAVSPDGKRLAFTRWLNIGVSDIFIQDLDGGPPRQVTRDGVEVAGLAWSETGRTLFYSSNRSGDFALWSIPVEGGTSTRLGPGLREVRRMSSAPGGLLAMELADLRANLAQVPRGGAGEGQVITDAAGVQWAGDYSRDGTLAYVADTRGGRSVWIQRPGEAAQKITFFAVSHMDDVRWSPDGRRLVFVAASKGRWALYEIAAGGGRPRALLAGAFTIESPSWEADGRHLLFASRRDGANRIWRIDTQRPERLEALSGPGWNAVKATPAGILAMKEDGPGIWKLAADGRATQLAAYPAQTPHAWTVVGDRQYWLEVPRRGTPQVMSASIYGGPAELFAKAPQAAWFSGVAVDPKGGDVVYTRMIEFNQDIGLMTLTRSGS